MEENQILDSSVSEGNDLAVTYQTRIYLNEIRKWAKFFAVLGFVGIGFLTLAALAMSFTGVISSFAGSGVFGGMSAGVAVITYLIIGLLYLAPIIYLNKFANRMKAALDTMNNEQLQLAFENMKSLFKFSGVLTIIILSLYVIIIVGVILVGVSSL